MLELRIDMSQQAGVSVIITYVLVLGECCLTGHDFPSFRIYVFGGVSYSQVALSILYLHGGAIYWRNFL